MKRLSCYIAVDKKQDETLLAFKQFDVLCDRMNSCLIPNHHKFAPIGYFIHWNNVINNIINDKNLKRQAT